MLSVCSQEEEQGETLAIITVRAAFPVKESRSTSVSLEPRKGMCRASVSSARMHSLSASSDLLISAPSSRVCLSLSYVSGV